MKEIKTTTKKYRRENAVKRKKIEGIASEIKGRVKWKRTWEKYEGMKDKMRRRKKRVSMVKADRSFRSENILPNQVRALQQWIKT